MRFHSRPAVLEAEVFQLSGGPGQSVTLLPTHIGGFSVAYRCPIPHEHSPDSRTWLGCRYEVWVHASKAWCAIEPGDYLGLEPPPAPGADPIGIYPIKREVFESRWATTPEAPMNILEALGDPHWCTEMPGRWHVEARTTHIVARVPGGQAILEPHDTGMFAAALQTALHLVMREQAIAEQRKSISQTAPGGPGGQDG